MGVAIWLYMWFIDKITEIRHDGIGKVLGGKPIKYKEVEAELGISQRTFSRWVDILEKGEYINTIRTPHGVSFSVNKAYKRFGNRYAKSGVSGGRYGTSPGEYGTSILDSTVDRTIDKGVSSKNKEILEKTYSELSGKLGWK